MTRRKKPDHRSRPSRIRRPVETGATPASSDGRVDDEPGPPRIRFDRQVWTVLVALFLLFVITVAFKIHGSSIGRWNHVLSNQRGDMGVLLGAPRAIRSDEWLVMTPAILSQAKSGFSVRNPQWGPAPLPLMASLPVRHWSTLIRPQFWGFFLLDLERAYSAYWNIKPLVLCIGMFLLLMLLTGNHVGISLLGTAWVFFSGFIQWWYAASMLMETGCLALLVIAVHYIAFSPSRLVIAFSAAAFAVCSLNFGLTLYPPFQVPLFYLALAILAGSVVPPMVGGAVRRDLGFRVSCAVAAFIFIAAFLGFYYRDAKQAIELMRGTVYPGLRADTGGDMSVVHVFNGFFGFFMSQDRIPEPWGNICEASNFVLLFPVPVAALLWRSLRKRDGTAVEWALAVYVVVFFAWAVIGFPRSLAVGTAFSMSPASRSIIGLGYGSIILCCVFLSRSRIDLPARQGQRLLIAVALLVLLIVYGVYFNRLTDGFATPWHIASVALVGGIAAYSLLARQRPVFSFCLLAPLVWSYSLVNPVAVGLDPLLNSPTLQRVMRIVEQDPDAGWAVYGSFVIADGLKVAGARVFNGTKFVPPLTEFRVLDPASSFMSVYNRFAHVDLEVGKGPNVGFGLVQQDLFRIRIDPAHEGWRRLGVRYAVLPDKATDPAFLAKADMILALRPNLWVYKYRWDIERTSSSAGGHALRILPSIEDRSF